VTNEIDLDLELNDEIDHELAFERTKYEPQSSGRSYSDLQVTNI
jgi:hypothetical protein